MRSASLDIAKGIGILLMVIGHTGCPQWLHDSIYSFHMPLFFILSGICLTEKRINDSIKDYVINKIRRLYLPFIKYGFFFYVLDLSINLSFYGDDFNFIGTIKDLLLIFAMIQTPALVACYWFLTALFCSSILGFVVLKTTISKRCPPQILVLLLLIAMVALQRYNIHLSVLFSYKTMYYTALFVSGYMLKRQILRDYFKGRLLLAFIFLFLCTSLFCRFNLQTTAEKPLVLLSVYFLSTLGSIGVIWISIEIEKYYKLSSVFKYLGEKTMDILTWHFSGLRLMNILLVIILTLPTDQIMNFPCIKTNPYYWYAYVPFSIFFSLSMGELFEKLSIQNKNKCHGKIIC